MVLKEKDYIKFVLCMLENEDSVVIFTGNSYSSYTKKEFNEKKYGDIDFVRETISKEKRVKYYSEINEISYDMFLKMVSDDFISEEEKNKFYEEYWEIEYLFPKAIKEVEKKYYIDKIKNDEFEIWRNSFNDKIFKISDKETYIDDEKYDIFYKSKENGEYEIKFFDKQNLNLDEQT